MALPDPSDAPLFDPAPVAELIALQPGASGRALVAELMEGFLREAVPLLEQVRAAVDAGEPFRAIEAAHSLKGGAGSFGLRRLQALARDLEQSMRRGEPDRAPELAAAMEAAYREALPEVRRYFAPDTPR